MTNGIEAQCHHLARAARAGLDWLQDPASASLTAAAGPQLVDQMRRRVRRAERLRDAAGRKPALSVFGPSQAGKSFLVSILARPPGGQLVADFAGTELVYINEINPEGHGESTGLTTRFTMSRPDVPASHPIRVELLSEADLACCLVNSFFMDGDRSETPPDAASIDAHLARHEQSANASGPTARGRGMPETAFRDLQEYVETEFSREAYGAALRSFWDRAAAIAPALSVADRADLLSILWGGHEAMTTIFRRLGQALEMIGNEAFVHVGTDALVPRETSIIDVKTLHGLGEGAGRGPIALLAGRDRRATLDRAVLCALAAELVLPMKEVPHPYFEQTDLLDFPGARNRFERPLAETLSDPANLSELLLRGKVAFLFDRYVARQEITGMLLCIPDGNMETRDLPRLVDRWIEATHGGRPDIRRAEDCGLIFVMTKFDAQLSETATDAGIRSRFDRRVQASLLEKFGKGRDPWVTNWSGGRPFAETCWLRNPSYFVEAIFDYDAAQRETLRPEKAARLAELREGCLGAESVLAHFRDPVGAWDAALAPNDGGVSYILDRLPMACDPGAKDRQIRLQARDLSEQIQAMLAPFGVSEHEDERLQAARRTADRVFDDIERAIGAGVFGELLSGCMVDRDQIHDRIAHVPGHIRIEAASQSGGLRRPRRVGQAAEVTASDDRSDGTGRRSMTLPEFQASTAVTAWAEALERFCTDERQTAAVSLTRESAGALAAALVTGAHRLRLGSRLVDHLKAVNYGLDHAQQARPAAVILGHHINRFVETLGQADLPPEQRVQSEDREGRPRPVFTPRPNTDTILDLPSARDNPAEEFGTDWVFALNELFEANALGFRPSPETARANAALVGILRDLAIVGRPEGRP